jgi:hypothetical protein
MRRLALLVSLVLVGSAAAGDGEPAIDLAHARILASPGLPETMKRFLPPGRLVERLYTPLPKGPLLVLGLPGEDAEARKVAEHLGVSDLHGGWFLDARQDADRPLVVVLAADPAALYAARFEFETVAPEGGEDPALALKEGHALAEATVVVRPGRRRHVSPFGIRALDARTSPDDAWIESVAGHANEAWLAAGTPDLAARCDRIRDHGVRPVVVLPADGDPALLLDAQAEAGVRDFAIDFAAAPTARNVVLVEAVEALRPGGLRTLTVLPGPGRSPRYDARLFPELRVAWSGGPTSDARRRAHEAGVPVLLLAKGDAPPDDALGRVLAGVVVPSSEGAPGLLEGAWQPLAPSAEEAWDVLGPHVPASAADGAGLLRSVAASLRKDGGADPRCGALADDLERRAALLPKDRTFLVPKKGAEVNVPWGNRTLRVSVGPGELRLGTEHANEGDAIALDVVNEEGDAIPLVLQQFSGVMAETWTPGPHVHGVPSHGSFGYGAALSIDAAGLGGDPYPTRVFRLHASGAKPVPDAWIVIGP